MDEPLFQAEMTLLEYMRLTVDRVFKTRSAWADHLGVSPAHVSGVLSGKKKPTKRMLDDLGLERVVIYRRKSGAQQP